MIETRELTDDELNTVSGGIIFVGGRPPILREDALNPQPLPPVRGELLPAVQISMWSDFLSSYAEANPSPRRICYRAAVCVDATRRRRASVRRAVCGKACLKILSNLAGGKKLARRRLVVVCRLPLHFP
jgi:bacteriocin-like protein